MCVPETTTKTVVSGTAKEPHLLVRGARKVGFLSENSRFAEAHRDLSQISRFSFFSASCLRNPYFYSVFWTSRSAIVKKCTFLKTSKNQGQRNKCSFRKICRSFGGPETPVFVVFSRPQKDRVQLSSFEATKIGFNYAPVSICWRVISLSTFWPPESY